MIYWRFKDNAGYLEEQVLDALKEGRVSADEFTLIEDDVWFDLRKKSRMQQKVIVNDPSTNRPVLKDFVMPRKDVLEMELNELESWFSSKAYIAEKIAYGRATREEYADVISQMNAKAERINEIRAELATL